MDTIPAEIPYLRSDAGRVKEWAARVGRSSRLHVGHAWSGSTEHRNDANRSISFESLAKLISDDVQFVSLQKQMRPADAKILEARKDIRNFGIELMDFADTAALMESLDLVITVDTSVAHLAGAMAKAVWVLLPFLPDWRGLLDRHDSPCYPSANLFTQQTIGDWASVIEQVKSELGQTAIGDWASVIERVRTSWGVSGYTAGPKLASL